MFYVLIKDHDQLIARQKRDVKGKNVILVGLSPPKEK
jgi:hypothetical protein